jgi:ornithine lipid hydroxylase
LEVTTALTRILADMATVPARRMPTPCLAIVHSSPIFLSAIRLLSAAPMLRLDPGMTPTEALPRLARTGDPAAVGQVGTKARELFVRWQDRFEAGIKSQVPVLSVWLTSGSAWTMKLPRGILLRSLQVRLSTIQWALLLLFAFRVGAQLCQKYWPSELLPPFASWQSGTLPYGLLLSFQVLILVAIAVLNVRMLRGQITPNSRTGQILLSVGSVYFAVMLARFGAAITFGRNLPFLGAALPAVFHLVLSASLLIFGLYHDLGSRTAHQDVDLRKNYETAVHWLTYPVLMGFCVWLHLLLLETGVDLLFSTYIPVVTGALAITFMEWRFPYRQEWQGKKEDLKNDVTFLVLVQIVLPSVLPFLIAVTILSWLKSIGLSLHTFWPHEMNPIVQAAMMILSADFLRYWLHRASHEWSPLLWRFHAVHHSPHKLYWVNVGRFHPIEKSVQFLCDAAPFILLGVSEGVLALYFVFYAVNGFFQHCNVEVRLGLLNYLISGPELHRWHHSWEPRESNKNYGNNVILWDLLFGSYFLPRGREVQQLGLRNRNYPLDFVGQMKTPFIKGADQVAE